MISIIIPTLNEEDYLPLLLESIKKQDFRGKYEIIVADAGSRDKTIKIAKKYRCRIVKGGLPAKGRNNGAEVAKGDILLFLDADVIIPLSFLKEAVGEFKKNKLGIAGFLITPIGGKGIDYFIYFIMHCFLKVMQHILPWSAVVIMARKSFHDEVGGFDEEISITEDCYYALQIGKIAKFGLIKLKCFTSVRRYEKDGRIKTHLKYFFAFCYTVLIGPVKSDIFNYKFGHYKDK